MVKGSLVPVVAGLAMAASLILQAISSTPADATIGEDWKMPAVSTIVLGEEGWDNNSPSGVAVNQKTNIVYVTNRNSDTVSAIDATTNKVINTISVGFGPAGVAVNPNTNLVYVTKANFGTISLINGSTNEVMKTLEIDDSGEFYSEGGIAVNEKTDKIYVLTNNYDEEGENFASISVIDGRTNELEQSFKVADLRWDYDVGDSARGIAVNSETNTIYVVLMFGDLYVIDGANNKVSAKVTIGYEKFPHQVEVNEETNMAYVSNFNNQSVSIIDGSINEIIKTVQVGYDPQGIAIDSETNAIYVVTYGGKVSFINGATHELEGKVPVGEFPERAAFNRNNGFLYVTNAFSNSISVIDTMSTGGIGEWKTAHMVGKFLNSEPQKPDQIFKLQYRVVNGTMESLDIHQEINDFLIEHEIAANVNSDGNGVLEIKFPRNFPYTNSGSGIENFLFFIEERHIEGKGITTDCFFVFSVPFTGSVEIGLSTSSILIKSPYHGDDIPDSCIPQTIAADAPYGATVNTPTAEQLAECSKLGIDEEDCTDIAILQKHQHQINERKTIEERKIQVNNAMYMIGIGAAIAGVIAFVTLRKRQ